MNFVDLFLGLALLLGGIYGWRKGLMRGLVGLLGIVVSIWIALSRGGWVGDIFAGRIGLSPVASAWIGAGILLVVSLAFFGLLTALLDRLVRATPLSPLNAAAGAALGIVNAALFLGLLLSFLTLHPPHSRLPARIAGSALAGPVSRICRTLVSWVRSASPSAELLLTRLKGDRGSVISRDPRMAEEITRRTEQVRTQVDSLLGPGEPSDTSRGGLPVPEHKPGIGLKDASRSNLPGGGAKTGPAPGGESKTRTPGPSRRPPPKGSEPVLL